MIMLGVVFFAGLILGLNGFTAKEAEPGIFLYIAWLVICAIAMAAASFFLTKYFINSKSMNEVLAILLSILCGTVLGFVINVVGFFASLIFTSYTSKK